MEGEQVTVRRGNTSKINNSERSSLTHGFIPEKSGREC